MLSGEFYRERSLGVPRVKGQVCWRELLLFRRIFAGSLPHQHKCALGEGNIREGGRHAEGQSDSDLMSQQEWRDCPEFVENQHAGENFEELAG